MKRFVQKLLFWLYIKIHSIFIRISIALYNTEIEILKADPNITDEKDKKIQRKRHRNEALEKFYAGQRDEKYVQDYYELLKKADNFMKNTTPYKMEVAAYKYGTSYGMKDKWGRRYEHYGFFDSKHKHSGKTIGEVLQLEYEERRLKDDNYELLYIFNNEPISLGLSKIVDVVEEKGGILQTNDIENKSKEVVFPLKVNSENPIRVNKIEELTKYLHIKKIGFEFRQLEFFIPISYGTINYDINSNIFKEIIDIKEVYLKNEYGKLLGFNILNYIKRVNHNNMFDVIKFQAIEMDLIENNKLIIK